MRVLKVGAATDGCDSFHGEGCRVTRDKDYAVPADTCGGSAEEVLPDLLATDLLEGRNWDVRCFT